MTSMRWLAAGGSSDFFREIVRLGFARFRFSVDPMQNVPDDNIHDVEAAIFCDNPKGMNVS